MPLGAVVSSGEFCGRADGRSVYGARDVDLGEGEPDVTRRILAGAFLGLTWGAALRGFMTLVTDGLPLYTWVGTYLAILLPSALSGAALGWAYDARGRPGRTSRPWLAAAPLLLWAGLALVFVGDGLIAVVTVAVGLAGGYALSGGQPGWARAVASLVALALLVGLVVVDLQPVWNARDTFEILLLATLFGVLAWACSVVFDRPAPLAGSARAGVAAEPGASGPRAR